MNLEDYNFQWREGFFFDFPRKRSIFASLKEQLEAKFITILYGQRRTGKTTLLKQLIDELLRAGVPRRHILYFSFDKTGGTVSDIIKQYQQLCGDTFETGKKFIFFDEIQKAANWDSEIKYYYDHFDHLKMFLTGSSSLFIQQGEIESLAGRTLESKLPPLTFREYLYFKEAHEMVENISFYREKLGAEYLQFLKKPYIDLLTLNDDNISKIIHTLLEKIIFQDIPQRFPVDEPELLKRLMTIVCSQPGFTAEYNSLAQELGRNRVTISNYFHYLEEAFLIKKIYNFSSNLLTSEKKLKKIYPAATGFSFYSGQWPPNPSQVFENSLVLESGSDFFYRDNYKNEVDVILNFQSQLVPIEVKFSDAIKPKALKPIQLFMQKNKINKGIIITKNTEEIVKRDDRQLFFIPGWLFALNREIILNDLTAS